MKIDKYVWDELRAALSPGQHELLKAAAKETGFPPTGWTAIPGLVTMAVTWAAQSLGAQLAGSPSAQLDTAEGLLVRDEIADQRGYAPNTVRQNLARWRRDIRSP